MRFFAAPQLLSVDELGYLPLPPEAASALFQVVARRYLKGSIVLTTNRGITEWGEIFDDTNVAAAMLDRLLHRATVVAIDGEGCRLRTHQARIDQLRKGIAPVAKREGNARSRAVEAGSLDEQPSGVSPSRVTAPSPSSTGSLSPFDEVVCSPLEIASHRDRVHRIATAARAVARDLQGQTKGRCDMSRTSRRESTPT
jgi:IstB-like ATP binding protein